VGVVEGAARRLYYGHGENSQPSSYERLRIESMRAGWGAEAVRAVADAVCVAGTPEGGYMFAAPAHAFRTRAGTRVRIRCLMHALVLIPGLLCDQALWRHQIVTFGGYVKMTVGDITGQSTLAEMAQAVLDKAPAHFSLAGFSLGGQVALEVMQAAPQRVERLALLSTTRGGLLPASQIAIREAVATVEGGGFEQYL
jgi:pimeloyl-ACP methyl ester carboxylesterase